MSLTCVHPDRQVEVICNYQSSGSGPDINNTVQMTYTADGNIETLTAINPTTGNQVTTYTYGSTLSATTIATTNRLNEEFLPDSSGGTDRIVHSYNFAGEEQARADQLNSLRTFQHDKLGRLTSDQIWFPGSGVDTSILRIDTSYEVRGLVEKVTSYTTLSATAIVNQVQHGYNDFAQLVTSYQEHGGAVSTSTSLKVQYGYANGSANTVRATSFTYPGSRQIDFYYDTSGSVADALSRPSRLRESSTNLTADSYVGRSLLVSQDRQAATLFWTVTGGSGYVGLDRFDRLVNSRWFKAGNPNVLVDQLEFGYDRNSNRLWRENVTDSTDSYDWLYTYDSINRLTDGDRGKILTNHTGMDTLKFAQEWGLDATGNWPTFKQDDDGNGSWDLNQSRTSNVVNEITNISGGSWATPAYNAVGNMTTIPRPGDPTQSYVATYDAWNRLVKLTNGTNTVAEYVYDGLNRRVIKKSYVGGSLTETRHYYYSEQWQVLEERVGSGAPESLNPERQFLWGLNYIDELICRWRRLTSGINDEVLYAQRDPNWNVLAIWGQSGGVWQIVQRMEYDPYGKATYLTASFASTTDAYDWETLYAGYRFDKESKLYQVRNRYYNTALGTWVSRDPVDADMNLMRYDESSPLNSIDPTGLACRSNVSCGTYVGGRGDFNFYLQPFYKNIPDRAQSVFRLFFRADTDSFTSNGTCCCCTKIGFIQILNKTVDYAKPPYDLFPNWEVDAGIPYPHQQTSNPCVRGQVAMMADDPGVEPSWLGLRFTVNPTFVNQLFETCLFCLEGPEKGASYGCFTWYHRYSNPKGGLRYKLYTRKIEGTNQEPSSRFKFMVCDYF